MEIRPLGETFGTEISGLDLSQPLDDATFARVYDAFLNRQVLCFRGQKMEPGAFVAFSRRFGELVPHDNRQFRLAAHPEILVLSNDVDTDGNQIGVIDAGDTWHSDHQFKERPGKATILLALKNPSQGGDTDFTNQAAAYDALPVETKARIEGLRCIHSISKLKNKRAPISGARKGAEAFYKRQETEIPDVTHPLVRVHPETGRKVLYCSPRFTIAVAGMDEAEGDALLDELIAHSVKKQFRYRHKWRDGDLVMWDNRSVNHRATGGYEYPDIRLIHRTTTDGEPTG
jgi:taurine dioxygenase